MYFLTFASVYVLNLFAYLCIINVHYCRAFNWPIVPDIREDIDNERLFDVMLVIAVTCEATLKKSYFWEKR